MTKSSGNRNKKTVEIPAVTPQVTADATDVAADVAPEDIEASDGPRVTRELGAITPEEVASAEDGGRDDGAFDERESGPSAEMSRRFPATQPTKEFDPNATVKPDPAMPPSPERRHNTLASITRPRGSTDPRGAPPPPPPAPEPDLEPPVFFDDGIPDETDYAGRDEHEWAVADQPTVALAPGSVLGARPQYLETDEHDAWPPRPEPDSSFPGSLPEAAASLRRRAIPRPDRTGLSRLASPTGRPMPGTPPSGHPRSAFPDPRMERLQELHRRRDAFEHGERDPRGEKHVTERVRQWWGDLRPGLREALEYQHEARASGVHPIPAQDDPSPTSRLGDVFGRLAASARGLTGRAQSVAAPAFKRIHDQAEHAAQAIVGRFEGDTARQQAPFLGPGRIAVFFRPGVSVGQAQRLLSSIEARPLRIIPRKHGFLAYVLPGTEAQVSGRLKVHPYVRDVTFMPMDEYGDPVGEDEQ